MTKKTFNPTRRDILVGAGATLTAISLADLLKPFEALAETPKKGGKFVLMKGSLEKINEEVAQLDNNKYSYTIHKTNTLNTNRHILEINQK